MQRASVQPFFIHMHMLLLDPGTKVGHEKYPAGMDIPDDKGCNVIHLAVLGKGSDEGFEAMIQAFVSQMGSIE
jgi:hypothetical protein